jgi:nucleoid-associated protein YgaU
MKPPSSVPGSFQPPRQPPTVPTQSLPHVRYYTTTGSETLAGLAERFYGNTREATRIYNANRYGSLRADRTPGVLHTLNDQLEAGVILLIP